MTTPAAVSGAQAGVGLERPAELACEQRAVTASGRVGTAEPYREACRAARRRGSERGGRGGVVADLCPSSLGATCDEHDGVGPTHLCDVLAYDDRGSSLVRCGAERARKQIETARPPCRTPFAPPH